MSISGKFVNAKPGDLFYETLASGIFDSPRLLSFNEVIKTVREYPNGYSIDAYNVKFTVVTTGEELVQNGDDRLGYYPKLDKANYAKMLARREELASELAKYDSLLADIADMVTW